MTYGEYYYQIKYDMCLKNGVWITNKPRVTISNKMDRKKAFLYYNKKFNDYWLEMKMR